MFDKGITLTLKLDDEQVKQITELVLGYLKKAKEDLETDIEITNDRIDNMNDKIERLSP